MVQSRAGPSNWAGGDCHYSEMEGYSGLIGKGGCVLISVFFVHVMQDASSISEPISVVGLGGGAGSMAFREPC